MAEARDIKKLRTPHERGRRRHQKSAVACQRKENKVSLGIVNSYPVELWVGGRMQSSVTQHQQDVSPTPSCQ
jgi:hypothetical protein